MSPDPPADEELRTRPLAALPIVAGVIVLGAGLWAGARIGYWYVGDEVVSGSYLRDPSAAWLPAFVAAMVGVCGVGILLLRNRLTGAAGLAVLGGVTVAAVIGAGLAVTGYPSIERARVIALDPETRTVTWTAAVPLTLVSGVDEDTGDQVTVTGSFIDHGCRDSFRAVTLDRATGDVLDVVDLPGSYPYATGPVAGSEPLADHDLVAEQGRLPFVCLN